MLSETRAAVLSLFRFGAALLVISLSVGCQTIPVGTGHGRVIDAVSKAPVPDATVKVSCGTPKPWHGHNWAEYTANSSAPDGAFYIDVERTDLRRCNYIFVDAFKDGYVPNDFRLTLIGGEAGLGQIVYVINKSDLPMLNLGALLREVPVSHHTPVDTGFLRNPDAAVWYFGRLYKSFAQSRVIADNPALEAWVRKHHCSRLREAYALLSESERGKLDMNLGDEIHMTSRTYKDSIVPFCGTLDSGPP